MFLKNDEGKIPAIVILKGINKRLISGICRLLCVCMYFAIIAGMEKDESLLEMRG